ncbi:MAG TPA: hypothetical protein VFZ08_07990 [Terriglobia bacterium]|nr:hypothetical protein [Terriglobia bacterium]
MTFVRRLPKNLPGPAASYAVLLLSFMMAVCLIDIPAIPAQSTTPARHFAALPDISELLKDVEKNQKKIDVAREKYACTAVEEQDQLSRQGKLKKRSFKQYEIFFIGGREVRRLVKKDGEMLNAAQQRKEDARVRKAVEKYEKQQRQQNGSNDPDGIGVGVFLRTSRFDHARWTRYRGRKVIAFDFAPNPDYQPSSFAEKVAHSVAGDVWVDPKAHTVVRLEAEFDRPVKIGGGLLASLSKGVTVAIEQERVNNELWLPSYLELHISAHVLLFKSFHMNIVDRYSDYRVFNVKSLEKRRPVGTSSQ